MKRSELHRTFTVQALVCAVLTASGLTGVARAADCNALCAVPPAPAGVTQIVIDATTGRIIEGQDHYPDGVRLRPVFVKNNPFKYQFSFSVQRRNLNGAIARGVLDLLPGWTSVFNAASGLPPAPAQALTEIVKLQSYQNLNDRLNLIDSDLKKLDRLLTTKDPVTQEYNKFSDAVTADSSTAAQLCALASALRPKLDQLTVLKDVTDLRDKIDTNIKALDDLLAKLKADVNAATANKTILQAEETQVETDETKTKGDDSTRLDKLKTKIQALLDKKDSVATTAKVIDEVFASAAPFIEIGDTLQVSEATEFQFTPTLTVRSDGTKRTVAVAPVTAGQPAVHVSAGIGFSTIPDISIVRQSGLAADGKTLESKFGYENHGHFKPSGIVLINAPLWPLSGPWVGPAAGLVISGKGDTANVEYLLGTSMGFKNNQVFLTLGYHAARVQVLGGGFKIGDTIPSGLTDPLPLQKNWRSGFMLALSIKLR